MRVFADQFLCKALYFITVNTRHPQEQKHQGVKRGRDRLRGIEAERGAGGTVGQGFRHSELGEKPFDLRDPLQNHRNWIWRWVVMAFVDHYFTFISLSTLFYFFINHVSAHCFLRIVTCIL